MIFVKWTISFCAAPNGANVLEVPAAQTLISTNDFGGNGGYVLVPGGDSPTGGNIDTALNTVATNAKAFFDNGTPLATIQNWITGTG